MSSAFLLLPLNTHIQVGQWYLGDGEEFSQRGHGVPKVSYTLILVMVMSVYRDVKIFQLNMSKQRSTLSNQYFSINKQIL